MRQGVSFGLVGGGAVARSFLAKHPWLADGLGPVTASRFRLASRIANALRAGYPVAGAAELRDCRTILVAVPENRLEETAADIADAIEWRGRHVIACEGSSRGLGALRERGAECAGLRAVAGLPDWFVVEGDRRARRTAGLFAEASGGRVIDIETGGEAAFDAGVAFAGELVPPLLEAARRCFRSAGVQEAAARKLAEAVCSQAVRGYWFNGGPAGPGSDAAKVEREASGARRAGVERYYRESSAGNATVFGPDRKAKRSHPR